MVYHQPIKAVYHRRINAAHIITPSLTFEKDMSYHDSIKHIKPDAKSLVMKFHLADECFFLYKWHKPVKLFADDGYYKMVDRTELLKLISSSVRLTYGYHYAAYQTLIIEMYAETTIRLEIRVDSVELYWKNNYDII